MIAQLSGVVLTHGCPLKPINWKPYTGLLLYLAVGNTEVTPEKVTFWFIYRQQNVISRDTSGILVSKIDQVTCSPKFPFFAL